jgi:hypothetical protein
MGRDTIFRITLLLLLAVTVVFASPVVNLQPTALRAAKASQLLFAALALSGAPSVSGIFVLVHLLDGTSRLHRLRCDHRIFSILTVPASVSRFLSRFSLISRTNLDSALLPTELATKAFFEEERKNAAA